MTAQIRRGLMILVVGVEFCGLPRMLCIPEDPAEQSDHEKEQLAAAEAALKWIRKQITD